MSKRIGILTLNNTIDNYGQVLQCFALQKYLNNLGYYSFLVKYQPDNIDNSFLGKIRRYLSIKKILHYFSKEKKREKTEYLEWLAQYSIVKEWAEERDFESFKKKYIASTECVYNSLDELISNPPQADAFICGSDQIWNGNVNIPNTKGWYLDFTKKRKIAYAASIGRAISSEEIPEFKKLISRIDYLSLRENETKSFCESLGFLNARIVLDPTLLLTMNDYSQLISQHTRRNTLFIYAINVSNENDLHWYDIRKYSSLNKLNVEICCSSGYILARQLIKEIKNINLTIPEWIEHIANSTGVVTSSFHGLVFCILFHTPFAVIMLDGEHVKANDRIFTLLETVGLSDRVLSGEKTLSEIMDKYIDWDTVDSLVDNSRARSINFLDEALKGI